MVWVGEAGACWVVRGVGVVIEWWLEVKREREVGGAPKCTSELRGARPESKCIWP